MLKSMGQHVFNCHSNPQGLILVCLFLILISTGCKSTEQILTDHKGLWVGWFWEVNESGEETRRDSKGVYHFEKNGKGTLKSMQSVWGTKFDWSIEGKQFLMKVYDKTRHFEIASQSKDRMVFRIIPDDDDLKTAGKLDLDLGIISKLELKRVFE